MFVLPHKPLRRFYHKRSLKYLEDILEGLKPTRALYFSFLPHTIRLREGQKEWFLYKRLLLRHSFSEACRLFSVCVRALARCHCAHWGFSEDTLMC